MTGLLEIDNPTTTALDVIFSAKSAISGVKTEVVGRGTQRWDFTDGSSVYKGSIQYSTPGGNPGILMRGATELGRTDIGMNSQTGGLTFGTTTTNNNPPTQFLIETDNNVSVPLGNLTVTVGNIIVGGTVDGIDIATDVTANTSASHAESHTILSHSDTTATGAELDTLTDTSDADSLHAHAVNDAKVSFSKTNVKATINHGATSGTTRPTGFDSVEWIGTVEPTNATNDDTWIDTT